MRWVTENDASFLVQLYIIFMLPNDLNELKTIDNFTPEDWARVCWSDECSVERGAGVQAP